VSRLEVDPLADVLGVPWRVLDYQRWLVQQPARAGATGYLFDEPLCRFQPEPGDELCLAPGLTLHDDPRGTRLTLPSGAALALPSPRATIAPWLERLDRGPRLAELLCSAGDASEREALRRFIFHIFGKIAFTPFTVAELERRISGPAIVRFPGSPYEIERGYWRNMAAVREQSGLDGPAPAWLETPGAFLTELRRLHALVLLGQEGSNSFYKPASPISDTQACPGRLHDETNEVLESTAAPPLFVRGLRVRVRLLGGPGYQAALEQSLGGAAAEPGPRRDANGLVWGHLWRARDLENPEPRDWFVPVRPQLTAHFEALRSQLKLAHLAAREGEQAGCIAALAGFHQRWVQLHPFACANQSLAMNLVNALLVQLSTPALPHLWLDQLALHLKPGAYARVFQRAVRIFARPAPSVASRYVELSTQRQRLLHTLAELERSGAVPSPGAPPELLLADS
jgi:hypothetical protein